MNALETLRTVAAHRVQISLDGDDLIMEAPAAPPPAVLTAIKQNKAEIVTVLRAAMRPENCCDDAWLGAVVNAARLGYGILLTKQELPC